MSLVGEVRRRNVHRMAGLYLVASWLVVQVSSTILPVFEAPAWILRTLIVVLAGCFVPALVFSWVFEITPEGLKRETGLVRRTSHSTNSCSRHIVQPPKPRPREVKGVPKASCGLMATSQSRSCPSRTCPRPTTRRTSPTASLRKC